MGLTADSTGKGSLDKGLSIVRGPGDRVVALAGNPNVGKSTVFNHLTGMHQHTGNWPGKTVTNAQGECRVHGRRYVMVDIPGTYSLMAHSTEEEVARDFICFGEPDAVIVVCDATCLERNLNLVLQTMEITSHTVVCVNLMDEAKKKHIHIDIEQLERELGVPVVAVTARSGKGLDTLMERVEEVCKRPADQTIPMKYIEPVEKAISILQPSVEKALSATSHPIDARWISLKLLENDETLQTSMEEYLNLSLRNNEDISENLAKAWDTLESDGISKTSLRDKIVSCIVITAEGACSEAVTCEKCRSAQRDRKIDRILTNKWTGFPIMLILLAVIFWITITGANYPSELLSNWLFALGDVMAKGLKSIGTPPWLESLLIMGIYRVLAWVVSVMLPPMAIFFPLFTLLEDLGYLPRVAFNLDKYFQKAHACGKQSLTMCMGFGCNAAGIVGCRIIDSPRERLIAMITNNFVPCNGRFPTLIAIISMFFVGTAAGFCQSALSALILTGIIVLGVIMTFLVSKILSATILKGVPSSFTLELPPYRRPQIGRVIVRSIFDRTLFVLGRAVTVAAPAGLIIWLLANLSVGGTSLLAHCTQFLDPFAHLLGLDGVILIAFILGFPANEIVIPIMIMAYMATGHILDLSSLDALHSLFVNNGWTWLTAVCTMLFSLMHWPCSTTCLTIRKESGSFKWTLVSFLVPTVCGIVVCFLVASIARMFGMA